MDDRQHLQHHAPGEQEADESHLPAQYSRSTVGQGAIGYPTRVNFPLVARFKILAIASQISLTDARGDLLYYVKQKAFKLKEAVTVYADEGQTRPLFTIQADRILDISARYRIEAAGGHEIATLQRHGMRSFWRTHYDIEIAGRAAYSIREENPWTKVLDGLFSSIPILGIFAGYLFHPSYLVTSAPDQRTLLRAVKKAALFEGRFELEQAGSASEFELETAVICVLMMLLLERARG